MLTKPFSIRFPESLTRLIQNIADRDNKTPSDVIREAVEYSAASREGYRAQLVDVLLNPKETLHRIREKLDRQARDELGGDLTRPEISAMMIFWHQAYLYNGCGYANPCYVHTLLGITRDLLTEATKQQINLDFRFYYSKLGIEDESVDLDISMAAIMRQFSERPSVQWAETLTRPIAHIANHLNEFSNFSISEIFNRDRLKSLLPVTAKGVDAGAPDSIISLDMKALLPDCFKFEIDGLKFSISTEPFSLVVEGHHHCYAFQAESVLSLLTFVENPPPKMDYLVQLKRRTLSVQVYQGDAIIHEHGGYRLVLSEESYTKLQDELCSLLKDRRWNWVVRRIRDLHGDF